MKRGDYGSYDDEYIDITTFQSPAQEVTRRLGRAGRPESPFKRAMRTAALRKIIRDAFAQKESVDVEEQLLQSILEVFEE